MMPISYRAAQTIIKRGDETALLQALDGGLDANQTNENGWSLLMLAAVEGATTLGRLLLEKGADLSVRNAKGATALGIATNRGYDTFVELIREYDQTASG